MDSLLSWLVALNLILTGYLFQQARRGPKRKFVNKLLMGDPIKPKHTPPPNLKAGWGVSDGDRRFFADFDTFAETLNSMFEDGPWRLQELADPEIRGLGDSPKYGRRYKIFYNQVEVGILQIRAYHDYDAATPNVWTEIELNFARLISFEEIEGFVIEIAGFTALDNTDLFLEKIKILIHGAALRQLWQIEPDRDLDDRSSGGSFEVRFHGPAGRFLDYRDRLQHPARTSD